ncbi:hypothetical protein [Cronobacter phage vB_Cdu_VP8]|nr:hypothetical protein [Cronobacter phage vB_Cdu_VP8]
MRLTAPPCISPKWKTKMAKQAKKQAVKEVVAGSSKRAGYKRGSNKRIDQVVEKIMRRARAVLRDDVSRFGKPKA